MKFDRWQVYATSRFGCDGFRIKTSLTIILEWATATPNANWFLELETANRAYRLTPYGSAYVYLLIGAISIPQTNLDLLADMPHLSRLSSNGMVESGGMIHNEKGDFSGQIS